MSSNLDVKGSRGGCFTDVDYSDVDKLFIALPGGGWIVEFIPKKRSKHIFYQGRYLCDSDIPLTEVQMAEIAKRVWNTDK